MHDEEHGGPPRSVVEAAAARITVQLVAVIFCVYAQIQGLGILAGGRARFSADNTAYEVAASFPGGAATWGLSLFLLGVVGLFSTTSLRRRLSACVFTGFAMWSLAFSLCFARATAIYSQAAATGAWVYGKDAAICIVFAAVMYSNHYRKEP